MAFGHSPPLYILSSTFVQNRREECLAFDSFLAAARLPVLVERLNVGTIHSAVTVDVGRFNSRFPRGEERTDIGRVDPAVLIVVSDALDLDECGIAYDRVA